MSISNKFISIEGIDCSGKSTLIRNLRSKYPDAVFVKEPGSTIVGKELKRILLNPPNSYELEKITEVLLFCSSFIETTHKIILPALLQGKTVFAERWFFSAIAYQEFALSISGPSIIEHVCNLGHVVHPHLNIILDVPLDIAISRLSGNGDRISRRGYSYMRLVYLYYTTECSGILIDAKKRPSDVLSDVIDTFRSVDL